MTRTIPNRLRQGGRMKALRLFALGLLALAGAALPGGQGPAWRYAVALQPGGKELRIEAAFAPALTEAFSVDAGAEPYLRDVEVQRGGSWRPLPLSGDIWSLPAARRQGTRLRYRFLLDEAARNLRDRDMVAVRGDLTLAAPSTFLLRPWKARRGPTASLRFAAPAGLATLCGIVRAPDGTHLIDVEDLENAPQAAFGAFRTLRVEAAGGAVEAAVPAPFAAALDEPLRDWVRGAMESLQGVAGRFPVARAAVFLVPASRGHGVVFGSTGGRGGAAVTILAAPDLRASDLREDWVLTHEFVHLCVPTLDRRHAWFTEGLATYLEPLARARRGLVTPEACWATFVKHLPEGLPKAGDLGLDRTPTWGRTYWGGALFCLVADLAIRKATENRQSLEDAVKALVAAGATKAVAMELEKALRLADAGLERPLLLDLYRRWATSPVAVDLDALWQRLGVVREGGGVRFDETAPEAVHRPLR